MKTTITRPLSKSFLIRWLELIFIIFRIERQFMTAGHDTSWIVWFLFLALFQINYYMYCDEWIVLSSKGGYWTKFHNTPNSIYWDISLVLHVKLVVRHITELITRIFIYRSVTSRNIRSYSNRYSIIFYSLQMYPLNATVWHY